jgi:hypothetical protein
MVAGPCPGCTVHCGPVAARTEGVGVRRRARRTRASSHSEARELTGVDGKWRGSDGAVSGRRR